MRPWPWLLVALAAATPLTAQGVPELADACVAGGDPTSRPWCTEIALGVQAAQGDVALLGSGGAAVFNADAAHAGLWSRQCAGLSTLSFGFSEQASLRGVLDGDRLTILVQGERVSCPLPLPGRHNAMNALAAAAACTLGPLRLQC